MNTRFIQYRFPFHHGHSHTFMTYDILFKQLLYSTNGMEGNSIAKRKGRQNHDEQYWQLEMKHKGGRFIALPQLKAPSNSRYP